MKAKYKRQVKLYAKLKGYDNLFNSWINKKYTLCKMSYLPESYTHSKSKIKVELNLPNYATQSNLKSETGAYTSIFALEVDLANSKLDIDKLNIKKLETTPVDLSKLSDITKNEVAKKQYTMN